MRFLGLVVTASAITISVLAVATGAARDINQDKSVEEQDSTPRNADSLRISEKGADFNDDFNDWNSNIERAKKKDCLKMNGLCLLKKTSKKECSGKLNKKYKCASKKDICCIPDPTTPAPPTPPTSTTNNTKPKGMEDLSFRHHGSHPANAKSWKLQCAWNARKNGPGHRSKMDSARDKSKTLPVSREMCSRHLLEGCGVESDGSMCNSSEIYRSIDGTCNNMLNTNWGSAPQPFERFIQSDYGDGVSSFRVSAEGKPLPNPREISRAMSNSNPAAKPKVTLMLMQWGQFLDHDITLTPEREIADEEIGCEGGVILSGQCLFVSSEYEKLTWQNAKMKCSEQNARLAVLENPIEFMAYAAQEHPDTGFWLGASDIDSEGNWVWLDGQPLGDQFPWHYGEPNNAFEDENCLLLSSDSRCSYEERYVCEKVPFSESSTVECCDWGVYDNSVSLGVDCVPINVTGDSFYEQDGRECIRFIRSMPTSSGCVNSSMEQINQNTAFVDGSMVYGSDADVANLVRRGYLGLLNTTESEHVGNGQPLPPRGGEGFAHQCPVATENVCFRAGDVRVDEQPGLIAMHTTFIRLHNIIAEELCTLNPNWCGDDEQIFQETRRIIIALIQQIAYRDWLPLVVGQTLMDEYNLNTVAQGYSDTYNETVNPFIRNVFATAAFRFGHSLISEVVKTANEYANLPHPGNFFNSKLFTCNVTSPSSLLKGLSRCPSSPIDAIVEPALTNHLFADHPANDGIFYGLDLVSLNIQRGRDHGIPGYTEWRDFCGLEKITKFSQLKHFMPDDLASSFQQYYNHVSDIDLFPAGLAEYPIADGLLGPTFACIIARQFANVKHGDRFWHEREGQPKPFTPEQLSSIRSQSLVSVLCRVTEHTSFSFQPKPFEVESEETNPVMNCSSYAMIDLQPWKENQKECGKPNRATRIVGGVTTEVNEYPWQVALVYQGSSSVYCGGSLINDRWVLTAAHCTVSGVSQVLLGNHLQSQTDNAERRINVARVVIHPEYNDTTLDNDFSLLELSTPVDLESVGPEIRPVCLPSGSNPSQYEDVLAIVSGWGTTSYGGTQPDALREATVKTMSNAVCNQYYYGAITDSMICAANSNPARDACQGDSGGPLVRNDDGYFSQIGVVSWGSGCADPNYSGVYSRVTDAIDWITSTSSSSSTCAPPC